MRDYARQHPKSAALLFSGNLTLTAKEIHLPADPALAAEQLYAALHTLDEVQAEIILIESPPAAAAWDALRDRLQRAAYQPQPAK